MDDQQRAKAAAAAMLAALAMDIHREGREVIGWLRRRMWMLRGIVLMNVACAAWNATNLHTELWWLALAGVALNAWGGLKALRVEMDFGRDIKKVRRQLRELDQKIQRDRKGEV